MRVKGSDKNTGRVKGSKNKVQVISEETKVILDDIINLEVSKIVMEREHKIEATATSIAKKHGKIKQYLSYLKKRYSDYIDIKVKEILNELYKK